MKLRLFLLTSIVFFLPFNLFLKFFEETSFINGLQIDYLIPKLYLVDCLVLLFLVLSLLSKKGQKILSTSKKYLQTLSALSKQPIYLFAICLSMLFICYQFFTVKPLIALAYILHLTLAGVFLIAIKSQKVLFNQSILKLSLVASIFFQTILSLYQWIFQKSLLPYQYLGETDLTNYSGVAKVIWNNTIAVPPYGTTAHPNILAGIVTVYFLLLQEYFQINKILTVAVWLCVITVIFLTQSISAFLVLLIYIILKLIKKSNIYFFYNHWIAGMAAVLIVVPLLMNLFATFRPSSDSITRRAYLNTAAVKIWLTHPFFGTGLNNFTTEVERYTYNQESARFAQPVHHVGLLWLAETGIIGLFIIGFIFYLTALNNKKIDQDDHTVALVLFSLLPLMVFDHYLISQTPFLYLAFFLLAMRSKPN